VGYAITEVVGQKREGRDPAQQSRQPRKMGVRDRIIGIILRGRDALNSEKGGSPPAGDAGRRKQRAQKTQYTDNFASLPELGGRNVGEKNERKNTTGQGADNKGMQQGGRLPSTESEKGRGMDSE